MVELSEDHEARMVWLPPHFMYALHQNKCKDSLRARFASMISKPTEQVGMFCTTSILQVQCDWRFQLHLWLAIVWGKPPFGLIINAPTCLVTF
jgi:hypothetical protein